MIEIEITTSAIKKMKLFAAIGVPEVWRHNGEHLEMFRLQDVNYESIASSQELSGLSIMMIEAVLEKRFATGETQLIRQFRPR